MPYVQTCPFKTDVHLVRQVCKIGGSHGGQRVCAEAGARREQELKGGGGVLGVGDRGLRRSSSRK